MSTRPPSLNAVPGTDLDAYLTQFAAALTGPRRRRNAVVSEVADGLHEATGQYHSRGLTADQAQQAAIAEFGEPHQLAAGFADELAIAYARRTVAALLVTGPLVGLWWLLLLAPAPWWPDPLTLWATIPVIPLVGAAALTGIAVIATTGHLTRWLPETRPDLALTLATRLCTACIAIDLTMLIILGARTIADHPTWPPTLAAAAVTASLTRIAWTTRTARRLHLRRGQTTAWPPATKDSNKPSDQAT